MSCWHTKYRILLGVIFLAVQTQQSAVVEILDETFKLVTERTPDLQHRDTSMTSHPKVRYTFISSNFAAGQLNC